MNNEANYNIICLIGYRACGKTTVARLLAERLGIESFDTDDVIVERALKPIARIFAEEGEPAFRSLESAVLAELLGRERVVLATGGGVPVREENRTLIRTSGAFVVWLTARPETIARRIAADVHSRSTRPALTDLPPEDEIRALLTRRDPFYRELADLTLETDDVGPDELVRLILERVGRSPSGR